MIAQATARNVRISPRKIRLVLQLIRQQNADVAVARLSNLHRAAAPVVLKVLKSALANAINVDSNVDVDSLVITEAFANEGATLKRFRPRAMGRAGRILKRTSHVTIVLGE
jgi:large subunit ribosomal protein L22